MKNILRNKKKLVSTILISLMITTIGFSAVIAKPPVDKTPDDDDWTGAGTGDMYTVYNDDVGIGTDSPATKLDVNGVITASGGNSNDWNTAFGWGDHSTVGYLTSYTETDPVYIADPAYGITSTQISNWDNAFGWGDHSTVGYLTSYTETDPIFGASDASSIASSDISNWNNAYGWGDHSLEGYDTTDDTWEMTVTGNITTLNNVSIGDPIVLAKNVKLRVFADALSKIAIWAYSNQAAGSGVTGIGNNATGNGVHGITSSGKGVNGLSTSGGDAIYGRTMSGGFAGNFQGDVNINGDLTVSGDITLTPETKVGYLQVPAAAFIPENNNDYRNFGYRVTNYGGASVFFYAPVYLPNGSKIISMTFYWKDNSTSDGSVNLMRSNADFGSGIFGLSTDGSADDFNSSYYAPISPVYIDNYQYAYYLRLYLPATTIHCYRVTIEYEYT